MQGGITSKHYQGLSLPLLRACLPSAPYPVVSKSLALQLLLPVILPVALWSGWYLVLLAFGTWLSQID